MERSMTEKAEADVSWDELRPEITKLALELGPLVVFFIANARADIFVATAWFMGAMVLSLLLSLLILKKIAVMPLVTGVVVVVWVGVVVAGADAGYGPPRPRSSASRPVPAISRSPMSLSRGKCRQSQRARQLSAARR